MSRVFEGVTVGPTARVGVVVPGKSPGALLRGTGGGSGRGSGTTD